MHPPAHFLSTCVYIYRGGKQPRESGHVQRVALLNSMNPTLHGLTRWGAGSGRMVAVWPLRGSGDCLMPDSLSRFCSMLHISKEYSPWRVGVRERAVRGKQVCCNQAWTWLWVDLPSID